MLKSIYIPSSRPLALALALLTLTLLLSACATQTPPGPVRDLLNVPQDLGAFLDQDNAHEPLFTETERQSMAERAREAFFAPWNRTEPVHSKGDLFWGFAKYDTRATWGESYRARGPWWVNGLALLADPGDFPNRLVPAIATAHASMRVLPTMEPVFANPTLPGEGFPFDYNQNSLVWAGTPLFVVQASADGAWLLCESPFAAGWIDARQVGLVDRAFMDRWQSAPLAALLTEFQPIANDAGTFLFHGRIGMLLPLAADPDDLPPHRMLVPVRQPDGTALAATATLPPRAAAHWPLVVTTNNIAALGNHMMGQPYGWGGLFERRDCSATLMDLFTPFGLRLPRNSRQQALAGEVLDISGLDREKRKRLLSELPPFLTLVGKRGHIMLYVGTLDGEPMIFHTIWGIRTTTTGPLPGRRIIGSTAVTTLTPGRELRERARGALLLDTLSTYTCLDPRGCPETVSQPGQ